MRLRRIFVNGGAAVLAGLVAASSHGVWFWAFWALCGLNAIICALAILVDLFLEDQATEATGADLRGQQGSGEGTGADGGAEA